jgi:hypothetical protein
MRYRFSTLSLEAAIEIAIDNKKAGDVLTVDRAIADVLENHQRADLHRYATAQGVSLIFEGV